MIIFRSKLRQHARENLQSKAYFVAKSVGATLKHPDFVVQSFAKSERDFVLGFAVSGDAIRMSLNHGSEVLVEFLKFPFQLWPPILEELSGPNLAAVIPQLAERLFQQVVDVEALVGRQDQLQIVAGAAGEILWIDQQGVFLSLDVGTWLPLQPAILAFADAAEGLAQMANDVKLVEQNSGLQGVMTGRDPERFPHIHHRQTDRFDLLFREKLIKLVHACFRAMVTAEPDWAPTDQVAHHDAIGMTLANRDLADTDRLRSRCAGSQKLSTHVLLVQFLYRVSVQARLLGSVFDRRRATASAHVIRKALGVERIVGQECRSLAPHRAALTALNSTNLDIEQNTKGPARLSSNLAPSAVVEAAMQGAALSTVRFFASSQGNDPHLRVPEASA